MTMNKEKGDVNMVEDKDRDSISLDKEAQATYQVKPGMTAEDAEWLASVSSKEQDRIFHKVDMRLVPMLALRECPLSCGPKIDH